MLMNSLNVGKGTQWLSKVQLPMGIKGCGGRVVPDYIVKRLDHEDVTLVSGELRGAVGARQGIWLQMRETSV